MQIPWLVGIMMIFTVSLAGCGRTAGLVVTHTPNPSDIHAAAIPEGRPFPYMWFYRTEVHNATDYPIQITGFEGCFYLDGQWTPVNILKRRLTGADFAQWYAQGCPVTNGWIPPRKTAVCDPNWHGVTSPVAPRCKWTYDGVDSNGRQYHGEAEIQSAPVTQGEK